MNFLGKTIAWSFILTLVSCTAYYGYYENLDWEISNRPEIKPLRIELCKKVCDSEGLTDYEIIRNKGINYKGHWIPSRGLCPTKLVWDESQQKSVSQLNCEG